MENKVLKFTGTVSTQKVGSECSFTFEIYEEDLPTEKHAREDYINKVAQEALWESGQVEWNYTQDE